MIEKTTSTVIKKRKKIANPTKKEVTVKATIATDHQVEMIAVEKDLAVGIKIQNTLTEEDLEVVEETDTGNHHIKVPDTKKGHIEGLQQKNLIKRVKKFLNNWLTTKLYLRWKTDYGNMFHKMTFYQV